MGKLDRIARAFGCHAHSMQLSAKEGQPRDFQTDPLPHFAVGSTDCGFSLVRR
jgi:hypothetical protein